MKKQYWHGQEILFFTEHWGKQYVWLKDTDGTHYMLRVGEDGQPILD